MYGHRPNSSLLQLRLLLLSAWTRAVNLSVSWFNASYNMSQTFGRFTKPFGAAFDPTRSIIRLSCSYYPILLPTNFTSALRRSTYFVRVPSDGPPQYLLEEGILVYVSDVLNYRPGLRGTDLTCVFSRQSRNFNFTQLFVAHSSILSQILDRETNL